jgi:DNA-binding transcriptional MerR regulator
MEQVLYRIGEASALLGLHDKNSNTLRSWVEEFKEFLGASANPEPGRPRFFTEDDLRVLQTVRDLRMNHLPYNEIRSRLAQGAHAVERQAVTPGEESMELMAVKEAAPIAADQIQALLGPMAHAAEEWRALAEQYRTRLEEREARVTTLEQRIDGLQARLEDLYNTAIQRPPAPQPVTPPAPRRRRWLFG